MMNKLNKNIEGIAMEWTQLFAVIAANYGMFLWCRSETRADHRDLMNIILDGKSEMKDFHGRLEKQDAEFKAFLMNKKSSNTSK